MTRFMVTLEQGVHLVWHAFDDMEGGEIYVKEDPLDEVTDIARRRSLRSSTSSASAPARNARQMVGSEDACTPTNTTALQSCGITIRQSTGQGRRKVPEDFV